MIDEREEEVEDVPAAEHEVGVAEAGEGRDKSSGITQKYRFDCPHLLATFCVLEQRVLVLRAHKKKRSGFLLKL